MIVPQIIKVETHERDAFVRRMMFEIRMQMFGIKIYRHVRLKRHRPESPISLWISQRLQEPATIHFRVFDPEARARYRRRKKVYGNRRRRAFQSIDWW